MGRALLTAGLVCLRYVIKYYRTDERKGARDMKKTGSCNTVSFATACFKFCKISYACG